ncbi:MAG: hypothetical protein R8K50_00080 [Mariprofundus sp.]
MMNEISEHLICQFIREHSLPAHYRALIDQYWLPLATRIASMHTGKPQVIGINGAQGTGKTTMAAALSLLLQSCFGLRCVTISIDDLYLTREQRKHLAVSVHPLLQTRGVPGTHDTPLGIQMIEYLKGADRHSSLRLPRFDKAIDDRLPQTSWPIFRGAADIILFEGWCVGTPAQPAEQLAAAINTLEANEDGDGRWRHYVNQRLTDDYPQLFTLIDLLIVLNAPDFETVYAWRAEQEQQLRNKHPHGPMVMDQPQLVRFIQHYERLTRHNLAILPQRADIVFNLDHTHAINKAGQSH